MPPQPPPLIIATVLLALLNPANSVQGEPVVLERDLAAADFLPLAAGALGLLGARGLWMLKRWAMRLAIVVCALDILTNAPSLTPPFTALDGGIHIAVCVLVILLAVLQNSRRAYA